MWLWCRNYHDILSAFETFHLPLETVYNQHEWFFWAVVWSLPTLCNTILSWRLHLFIDDAWWFGTWPQVCLTWYHRIILRPRHGDVWKCPHLFLQPSVWSSPLGCPTMVRSQGLSLHAVAIKVYFCVFFRMDELGTQYGPVCMPACFFSPA